MVFFAALDSVNYGVLLNKLKFYGIDGKFHDLITSYLSDRYQRVLIISIGLSYAGSSSWDIVKAWCLTGVHSWSTSFSLLY